MENVKRQASYPACGRLIVLQSLSTTSLLDRVQNGERFTDFVSINFPSMPDAIDLIRRADYAVQSPWGFPDGIHVYRGTQPLEIPFSFKLHAMDKEYCPEGVKTLLELAAVLHSLTLPLIFNKNGVAYGVSSGQNQQAERTERGVLAGTDQELRADYSPVTGSFPPPTCYLELIRTEVAGVGIACVGYVKDARVRLRGPFLKGPGASQNLPIAGEFEFTFVHHPGHSNNMNLSTTPAKFTGEQQAYAQDVRGRLYNTINLMTNPDGFASFSGGGGDPATVPAPPPKVDFTIQQPDTRVNAVPGANAPLFLP